MKRYEIEMLCSDFNGEPIRQFKDRINLEPKDHARFHEEGLRGLTVSTLLSVKSADLFIVVESFTGEVVRVPGDEIQEQLRKAMR